MSGREIRKHWDRMHTTSPCLAFGSTNSVLNDGRLVANPRNPPCSRDEPAHCRVLVHCHHGVGYIAQLDLLPAGFKGMARGTTRAPPLLA